MARRLEFSDLPKTISGKIRRGELRLLEQRRREARERAPMEFFDDDFRNERPVPGNEGNRGAIESAIFAAPVFRGCLD